jgi:hypothetical protein
VILEEVLCNTLSASVGNQNDVAALRMTADLTRCSEATVLLPGSPWPFCPLHPLPQSLSLALSVWTVSQQSPAPRFFTRENLFFSSFLCFGGFFS